MPRITFPRGSGRDLVITGEVIAVFSDANAEQSPGVRSEFTLCRAENGSYVLGLRVALRCSARPKSLLEALTFSSASETVDFLEQLLGSRTPPVEKCIEMASFKDESFQALRASRAGLAPPSYRRREARRALRG